MIIYSDTILSFLKKIKVCSKTILKAEMGLNVRRQRVEYDGYLHPLHFVVFEKANTLGYFDSHSYQIGINKNLIHTVTEETLLNIIRHELAHFYCFLKYKNSPDKNREHGEHEEHGIDYRNCCKNFGWGEEVYHSKLNLNIEEKKIENLSHEHVLAKVKKLLALASSDNQHEAELATIKANQLLLQYNLKDTNHTVEEDETCLKKVLFGKRVNSKHQAIYDILKSFFVQPIFNYGRGQFYLEVIGSRVNVEMAEYVALYLDRELDHLFKLAKNNEPSMKGIGQKSSFMKGLAQGYLTKINTTQQNMAKTTELMVIQDQLDERVKMVYGRLSHRAIHAGQVNGNAQILGNKAGKDLSIRPGVQNKTKTFFLPLGY